MAELCTILAETPLLFQPGTKWHYGLNFDVLAYVIEIVSGVPFEEFLKSELFDRLNMNETFFAVPDHLKDRSLVFLKPSSCD